MRKRTERTRKKSSTDIKKVARKKYHLVDEEGKYVGIITLVSKETVVRTKSKDEAPVYYEEEVDNMLDALMRKNIKVHSSYEIYSGTSSLITNHKN